MDLSERISQDYIASYKAKDAVRLGVLRLLKTAVTNRLVELKQPGGKLSDAEIMDLVLKQAKQRRDSIDQYLKAGRKDLADREEAELSVLGEYLPKQLSEAELNQAVLDAIAHTGASSPQDMGKVVGFIMAQYKGQVDGKQVSALVKEKLARS